MICLGSSTSKQSRARKSNFEKSSGKEIHNCFKLSRLAVTNATAIHQILYLLIQNPNISLKRGVTRFTTHQSASTARGQHDPAIRQGLCIRIKPFLYVKHFKNIKVSHKHCTKKSQKYDKNFRSPDP